jgi:hypothetical protein
MIGKKRFRDHSSADEERNKKSVHKRQNISRKGRYSAKNKSAWPELLQSLDSQLLENKISYLNKPNEEQHEKEIRDMKNDIVKKLYLHRCPPVQADLKSRETPA